MILAGEAGLSGRGLGKLPCSGVGWISAEEGGGSNGEEGRGSGTGLRHCWGPGRGCAESGAIQTWEPGAQEPAFRPVASTPWKQASSYSSGRSAPGTKTQTVENEQDTKIAYDTQTCLPPKCTSVVSVV